jgi:predicted component of type VI protein secretion system
MGTLEIIEGPDAGRMIELTGPAVVGRDDDADIVIADAKISRQHARLSPDGAGVRVEDLGSSNGTFIDGHQIFASASLQPGQDLVIGVTVLELRGVLAARDQSGVRPVPPALAIPAGRPDYVERLVDDAPAIADRPPALAKLVDSRVRAQARLAPLAILALAVLVVVVYLARS